MATDPVPLLLELLDEAWNNLDAAKLMVQKHGLHRKHPALIQSLDTQGPRARLRQLRKPKVPDVELKPNFVQSELKSTPAIDMPTGPKWTQNPTPGMLLIWMPDEKAKSLEVRLSSWEKGNHEASIAVPRIGVIVVPIETLKGKDE